MTIRYPSRARERRTGPNRFAPEHRTLAMFPPPFATPCSAELRRWVRSSYSRAGAQTTGLRRSSSKSTISSYIRRACRWVSSRFRKPYRCSCRPSTGKVPDRVEVVGSESLPKVSDVLLDETVARKNSRPTRSSRRCARLPYNRRCLRTHSSIGVAALDGRDSRQASCSPPAREQLPAYKRSLRPHN